MIKTTLITLGTSVKLGGTSQNILSTTIKAADLAKTEVVRITATLMTLNDTTSSLGPCQNRFAIKALEGTVNIGLRGVDFQWAVNPGQSKRYQLTTVTITLTPKRNGKDLFLAIKNLPPECGTSTTERNRGFLTTTCFKK